MSEHAPVPPDGDLFPVAEDELTVLRTRLATTAQLHGLLEVRYRLLDSPVGRLLLAATDRGLVRIAYEREGFDAVLTTLARRVGPRVLEAPQPLEAASRQLEEYFTGQRRSFDLPLDLTLSTGFRLAVQRSLPTIDYGTTRSYAQVAEQVGNPAAVRAVGSACATNPLPVVLPCHRVLRSDGSLGGYVGGLPAKSTLLTMEQTEHAA